MRNSRGLRNAHFGALAIIIGLLHPAELRAQNPLWQSGEFALYPDSIVQRIGMRTVVARAISATAIASGYQGQPNQWQLTKDIGAFPQYVSDYPISDAIYNMSLEEMQRAIEPDSTFRTGKEWAGVWTRDISYSIILSMAFLQPQVARNSLLRKVNKNGRIIQDTGTGGAWPVSSDRMIWAVAAWELYKTTGDMDWLRQAFAIIRNSIGDDLQTIYDPRTGLVKGESSFLDWREQTYPAWMQPADIFESENLGTNAVHYKANMVLADMADLLHDPGTAAKHRAIAAKIRIAVNRWLWMPGKEYYGQYLYGRTAKTLSPRSEALGEALSVVFDIADSARQKTIVAHTPVTAFGISCIYPQIPSIPPYHNDAVWPFVQTFWLWAAAKTGNERSVMESIADIYRPAAMFLTNKENFVADNGDFKGTQINSSNMLWSLSGNLSIVYKVLFGIEFRENGLLFHPFVPKPMAGRRTLSHFVYRGADWTITMEGYGNKIKSFSIDGKTASPGPHDTQPFINTDWKGAHALQIVLADNEPENIPPGGAINKLPNSTTPAAPILTIVHDTLNWPRVDGALAYVIYKDGSAIDKIPAAPDPNAAMHWPLRDHDSSFAAYQVLAMDPVGLSSFLSEPVLTRRSLYFSLTANPPLEISREKNKGISIPITIDHGGNYLLDFQYGNGNGPINTENKCAIRTVGVDGHFLGTEVFPQRGKGDWISRGYSNGLPVNLAAGRHTITLSFEPFNENMNGETNQAMLDQLRLTRIGY
jgi:Bacterial alpha-L-rhamnosidase 6 hairpin glycosidase domain